MNTQSFYRETYGPLEQTVINILRPVRHRDLKHHMAPLEIK